MKPDSNVCRALINTLSWSESISTSGLTVVLSFDSESNARCMFVLLKAIKDMLRAPERADAQS